MIPNKQEQLSLNLYWLFYSQRLNVIVFITGYLLTSHACRPAEIEQDGENFYSLAEEEIDVVTISDRPEKLVTRINIRKRTTSLSTPCSRLPSPSHMLPTKKRRCHSKRTHRLSSAGSNYGDGMESDDEQRRASHNVLERKRRDDLKYSFQVLRGQIPELKDNQRAPKVTILRKAAEYIKQIREEDEDMQTRMDKEKRRESKLLQRLAYLKSLA